eukprot:XP_015577229.2 LOW QUALITY PROTEIN: subtilisin-like protease SBT1.5 [Ricinus communis]
MGCFWSTIFIIFCVSSRIAFSEINTVQTFIVSVENSMKPVHFYELDQWYSSILKDLKSNSSVSIGHIYKTVFEGFSVELTPLQAQELGKRPEILGMFPEHIYQLQTTRSPEFLGLRNDSAEKAPSFLSEFGADVIIGMLDTGIWPELYSFRDDGLGPIPSTWKGECQGGEGFPKTLCNRKLIGVRYFTGANGDRQSGPNTARDTVGHGTHTASTAAGQAVTNASFLGTFARGTAVGIAPKARLAIYKVCTEIGCRGSDILAGFDKAVEDGVNVISVSLGSFYALPLIDDEVAIGSFGAMVKGIIVSASAGNSGPQTASVCNVAPWIITVGASSIDRKFPADLLLEDGGVISGVSLFNGAAFPENEYWPLIYAANASLNSSDASAYCDGSLDQELVSGKIVVCDTGMLSSPEKGLVVKASGGVGAVVANVKSWGLITDAYLTPGLSITDSGRRLLLDYMSSTPNPRAMMVFRGTQVGVKPAPVVAFFSSRGPNTRSMYVMKPDVIAPGVDILAGWSKVSPPSGLSEDKRSTEFNIISGTSMSCPHVSGIAALLKGSHSHWSPAMIKSAIMTTAYTHDQDGNPLLEDTTYGVSTAGDMGAGHVDPEKANDPGLVYDMTSDDYVDFLCASNLTQKEIKIITHRSVECKNIGNAWDLNYPAISVPFQASKPSIKEISVKRTVTHVEEGASSYSVEVKKPEDTDVTVDPPLLVFTSNGEKLSYTVRIVSKMQEIPSGEFKSEFGQLTWTDGTHRVTSPLVVTWYGDDDY